MPDADDAALDLEGQPSIERTPLWRRIGFTTSVCSKTVTILAPDRGGVNRARTR
jgi:hypothetical protein